ncbi:AFG1/ZapE family ATPase [Longimicrobium terrae]|uniref:Cell division protein ZapE n=1 Tax=Longimicrobium terrae TaxID=1639882 RepID=A0A841H3L6_9BACT|nr:cell division protein ZapE [Longimicrobium terrae]MBB6072627.1 cell division protein ZapE [Longimicrobium terrae]NNC28594.1 cell division protein ZapE [Longimicrobium terrae]
MLHLESLLERIPARPDAAELVAGFVPPPRFAAKRFEDYTPDPRHPSQAAAVARLRAVGDELQAAESGWSRMRAAFGRAPRGGGVYLDGGFGVGKTHLLAALWHASPRPSAYLSFDELVYTIGLLGVDAAREAFRGQRLVAVDEWELDDPGNLKLAIAFLRGALADGVRVATTSNTIPDELGRGRFDQKSFTSEIEELATAFEVLRVEGEDFRHRRFQADPRRSYFLDAESMGRARAQAGPRSLVVPFPALLAGLGTVHPIRFHALVDAVDELLIEDVRPMPDLYDALRWVHFVDKAYDGAVALAATAEADLGDLFRPDWLTGPYGKKFSRCLSRMEEMLGERRARLSAEAAPPVA